MDEIRIAIAGAVKKLFNVDLSIELTRPDEQFGDYSTNVALKLSKELSKNPREIAEAIVKTISVQGSTLYIERAEVAGPGFINVYLKDSALWRLAGLAPTQKLLGQEILVEFGDPNPFKEMHLGHLYTAIVGDVISNLLQANGATVRRLSYHGDVGMHVAKAIWGIIEHLKEIGEWSKPELDLNSLGAKLRTNLGAFYVRGAKAFEENEDDANAIKEVNEHIYTRDDERINSLHSWGTEVSFGYFDQIFKELNIIYEPNGRYLESVATKAGVEIVKQNIGKVFEASDGAIVYRGEKVGLHTRVFINSRGLPTYEAKDLGLVQLKNRDYPDASQSIIITAHEQSEYFKVMLAALGEIKPELAAKTRHIAHGFLSLTTGKMSSRTGSVHSAAALMAEVQKAAQEAYPESDVQMDVYLAALKYTFLKNRIGGDIIFDIQESVSLEGNSGPYLQYAHARARSILAKVVGSSEAAEDLKLNGSERSLLRKIGEYPEVVERAVAELMPHNISTYLYELSQAFNSFYEHNRVINDPRQALRLKLVKSYADTLQKGLQLLNIPTPKRM